MTFKKLTVMLLILSSCKSGPGAPELLLEEDEVFEETPSNYTKNQFVTKEYILPSMRMHNVAHGGFDVNIAADDSVLVAGLIKVFDPNLGSYPQKIMSWSIEDEQIQFHELNSGTQIFKTNFNDASGINNNFVKIGNDNFGSSLITYIDNNGKLKVISDNLVLHNLNIDCDSISSALDDTLGTIYFSCLKNLSMASNSLSVKIIDSNNHLTFQRTYQDIRAMSTNHVLISKDGEQFVIAKNYANFSQDKNLSIFGTNTALIIERGQRESGNLELTNEEHSSRLCVTQSNNQFIKYDFSQIGIAPIVGMRASIGQTLPNCLNLDINHSLFFSDSSLSNDKGFIINNEGKKLLDLNTFGLKKIFLAKKMKDSLFIIGINDDSRPKMIRVYLKR